MTQEEKREYLIEELLKERNEKADIPSGEFEQKQILRSLFNIRLPKPASEEFLKIQDEYLKEETERKGITDIEDLEPVQDWLYLWQGDITTLKCGAIVNAANSQMLGCFYPCHKCIDNAIHTFSGIQLRTRCGDIMKSQGFEEPTGRAKITPAYNLPCDYIIHTVGPIITSRVTADDCELLRSCYRSCLEKAYENDIESIAFCCISTGEFHFPNELAAQIAVETVKEFIEDTGAEIKVIFNVFKDYDLDIYEQLLK
ncbi:MAG: protein-ADP-ribose hydrolase [Ruminococcus sp.]|nr:protein-ADP-ribose hydrolase [Ruminococcus sp.]